MSIARPATPTVIALRRSRRRTARPRNQDKTRRQRNPDPVQRHFATAPKRAPQVLRPCDAASPATVRIWTGTTTASGASNVPDKPEGSHYVPRFQLPRQPLSRLLERGVQSRQLKRGVNPGASRTPSRARQTAGRIPTRGTALFPGERQPRSGWHAGHDVHPLMPKSPASPGGSAALPRTTAARPGRNRRRNTRPIAAA